MMRWLSARRTMLPPTEAAPRILIVDDQQSNVRLLEHTLRRAGYTDVRSTNTPGDVVALHAQDRYDLILLDLQMPDMDGFAVMDALKEIRRTHRVSILVISADCGATSAALSAGADAFMTKPFRLPDLVEHVRSMLERAVPRGVEEPTAPGPEDHDRPPEVGAPKIAEA
jgi:CheY-like chemotaxis protein